MLVFFFSWCAKTRRVGQPPPFAVLFLKFALFLEAMDVRFRALLLTFCAWCAVAERPSCMTRWLSAVGVAEEDAHAYVQSKAFRHVRGLTVEALMASNSEVLGYLNLTVEDRSRIVNCSRDGTCPLHVCQNGGSCSFSETKGRFVCKCPPGWQGSRCTDQSFRGLSKKQLQNLLKKSRAEVEYLRSELDSSKASFERCKRKVVKNRSKFSKLQTQHAVERDAWKKTYTANLKVASQQYRSCRAQLSFPFTSDGCGNGKNALRASSVLVEGQALVSADGRYRLALESGGRLVAYEDSTVFWEAPAQQQATRPKHSGSPQKKMVARLLVKTDGNVQLVDSRGTVTWQTRTGSPGQVREVCFLLENSRRISLRGACGAVLWTSGTSRNQFTNDI